MKKIDVMVMCFMMLASSAPAGRNVILIVPDGCSIPIWSAIRAMTVGTDGKLNIDRLPMQGRCRTYSANAMITDSAAAATAYACGVKTNNGVIGMSPATVRGDSLTGRPLRNIVESARKKGLATGLVTTTSILDATPAAFYSHRADRGWAELIALDLVNSGVDVIMGGGREYMIPQGASDEDGKPSKRTDSRNLIAEMQEKGYSYIHDRAGLDRIDPAGTKKIVGLFSPSHMDYELDREKNNLGEPGLWEMTRKALDVLSKNKKGFFLLVEAGLIDHAAHGHDTDRFLWEGISCDKTIGIVMEFARENNDTFVIVVPDHGCGGPYLVGMKAADGTIISYDDAGFTHYTLNTNGFPVNDHGKPIAIQWIDWKGHTGEDVGYFAMLNRKEFFGGLFGGKEIALEGLVENTDIHNIIMDHLDSEKREKKLEDIVDP
ncbi:alkaline phosphatase [bacterium]|nr:alkaline phosphatase [bacterium]